MSSEVLKLVQDKVALTANTQASWTAPAGTVRVAFQTRSGGAARWSITAGVVATPTESTTPNVYTSIFAGQAFNMDMNADLPNATTFYFATSINDTMEIIAYVKNQPG